MTFPKTHSLNGLVQHFAKYTFPHNAGPSPHLKAIVDPANIPKSPDEITYGHKTYIRQSPFDLEWKIGLGAGERIGENTYSHWTSALPSPFNRQITIHAMHRIGYGPLNGNTITVICKSDTVIAFGGYLACPPGSIHLHWPLHAIVENSILRLNEAPDHNHRRWQHTAPIEITPFTLKEPQSC